MGFAFFQNLRICTVDNGHFVGGEANHLFWQASRHEAVRMIRGGGTPIGCLQVTIRYFGLHTQDKIGIIRILS